MTAFAGCYAPRGDAPARVLDTALDRDGPATRVDLGELAVAWTPPGELPHDPVLCVLDGRVRTDALAAELGLDPGSPPAGLVAEGYARLGDGVLERIGGEFALVIWNRAERHGLLARDRLAARPLFVAEHAGALLFASEVRNLLALLPTRPAPDGVAMAHWLGRSGMPDNRTLFAGIRGVPGGGLVRLADGGWDARRFWSPRYRAPRSVPADQAAVEVRDALGHAVARALAGADRPGVMLSGGLDSAVIAALASAAMEPGAPPVAYSGVFPSHPEVDESAGVRRVRDGLGVPGVEAELGAGSALAGAIEFTRAWELPSVTPNRFVWTPLLRRAAADGIDVMLDGEGGDELFGCSTYLVADHLLAARPLAALRTSRRLPGMGSRPRPRWIARSLLVYGARGALPRRLHERMRAARGHRNRPDWLTEDVADPRWAWKRQSGPRWWASLAHQLTSDSVGAADQNRREAAMHGLAFRHPLRNPELIDLVLGLPPELAFHPRLDRPLLRAAMEGQLPDQTLRDTSKPFFNALAEDALTGPDLAPLHELLDDPHAELAARVRTGALAALLDRAATAAAPPGWELDVWRLATLEIWLEHQADPSALDPLLSELDAAPHVTFRTIDRSGSKRV